MSKTTEKKEQKKRSGNIKELFTGIETELIPKLRQKLGAELKVSFYDITTGEKQSASGEKLGWAASMIKVPVLIAACREVDQGNLSLEEELRIDHRFTLDPSSEISSRPQGTTAEVFELLNYMILASCNESTNMLADRVGIPNINRIMNELGCPNTRMGHLLHRGAQLVEPGIDGTYSNTTTANEMTQLMSMIYTDRAASAKMSSHMSAILENRPEIEYGMRSVNTCMRNALPTETIVGAKSGLLEEDIMETACIDSKYVITVMINKIPSKFLELGGAVIGMIGKRTYEVYAKK